MAPSRVSATRSSRSFRCSTTRRHHQDRTMPTTCFTTSSRCSRRGRDRLPAPGSRLQAVSAPGRRRTRGRQCPEPRAQSPEPEKTPRRTDLKRVLVIGSGPIVIGQACEFDYSGSQACKALRAEGLEVVLVNSNPATIMTDPELADRTYVEPLTADFVDAIIARERPDALLPTVGGQTALNLAVDLAKKGTLEKFNVKLIGASIEAIKVAEDRLLFKDA